MPGAGLTTVLRTVVIPGSLPYSFTGLKIGMGVAWFLAGRRGDDRGPIWSGLPDQCLVHDDPLPDDRDRDDHAGLVGFASSALIRFVGSRLMAYRARSIGS